MTDDEKIKYYESKRKEAEERKREKLLKQGPGGSWDRVVTKEEEDAKLDDLDKSAALGRAHNERVRPTSF